MWCRCVGRHVEHTVGVTKNSTCPIRNVFTSLRNVFTEFRNANTNRV